MRNRLLLHIGLASTAALAAVGAWFLWSGHTTVPAWVGIPLTAKVLFITLAIIARTNRVRAYTDGIASAQTDPVTRLPSPTVARQVLALEFAAAERGRELTVVLFSIDNFSKLGALDGGKMGARLLMGAGAVLRRRTRGMHVSAQHITEGQFISVLGGAGVDGANVFTGRVRKELGGLKVGAMAPVISAAICAYEPGMHSTDALIYKAEQALDKAKRSGGVEVANEAGFHLGSATTFEIA